MKHGPNERTDQNSRKRASPKEMEISNLSDAEFKTLVIMMPKELFNDLSSIKKIQSETKDTLIEIKNNLQGNNNNVAEAKNQINELEHKEEKKNQSEQEVEKRIQKNENSVSSLMDNISIPKFVS